MAEPIGYGDAFLESLGFVRGTWGYWIDIPRTNPTWLTCACGSEGGEEDPAESEWWITYHESANDPSLVVIGKIPTQARVLALLLGLGINPAAAADVSAVSASSG